jgi:prevent-host-death family protein
MQEFASTEAKDKWGLITDTALREPVAITRHGRPALIVTSVQDYQALQRLKYDQLRADIQEGLDDLENGQYTTKSVDDLIAEGKKRLKARPGNGNASKIAAR